MDCPSDSSSKTVYTLPPSASGSCWNAKISPALSSFWPGAASRANVLCLPPSCQIIAPVRRFTLEMVQVKRELISKLPSVSRWTALMWNPAFTYAERHRDLA